MIRADRPWLALVLTLLLASPLAAQTPVSQAPPYAAPRMPDGVPDLTGTWMNHLGFGDAPDFETMRLVPGGRAILGPWPQSDDPTATDCLPNSTPRIMRAPYPIRIVQAPGVVVLLYEYLGLYRVVPTDGRPHPPDLEPLWMGHSVGRWDGDTLVVDVVSFNDRTWLDTEGHKHSDAVHVVERFRRAAPDRLSYEVTVTDPKVFATPWTARKTIALSADPKMEMMEFVCAENNKESALKKKQ